MTKTVSIRLPGSLLLKVDALTRDRNRFVRRAIEEKIAHASRNHRAGRRAAVPPSSPFEEYGVTLEEVERSYDKTVRAIDRERRAGQLKPWKRS